MVVKSKVCMAGVLLALGLLSGCSGADSSNGETPNGKGSEVAVSQDPQVFSDVVAGAFTTSSSHARAVRLDSALLNLWDEACGNEPIHDLSSTALRFDQARYADLDLIEEKGLVELEDERPPSVGKPVDLFDCEQDVLPSAVEYVSLADPWGDATREAAESKSVSAVEPEVADCLERESGFKVSPTDPTRTYLSATDLHLSEAADWETEMSKLSQVYVSCTGPYFEAMEAELQVAQDALVERNRELLERFAQEISAAGYVP